MELGIKYLHWLYRARWLVYHAKRSSKASKTCGHYKSNRCLSTLLKAATRSGTPRRDEEEENEGDPEGGHANEERLTRVLALRAPVETGWNSWYYMIESTETFCNL